MYLTFFGDIYSALESCGRYYTLDEAQRAGFRFAEANDPRYDPTFFRSWTTEGGYMVIDFGSWSNYIYIFEVN